MKIKCQKREQKIEKKSVVSVWGKKEAKIATPLASLAMEPVRNALPEPLQIP